MAVAWQATGTLAASTGADITPVIPSHLTDDILILIASARALTVTLATPSGWTLVPLDVSQPIDWNTAPGDWRTYLFYKRATSASETNPLCDWSGTTGDKYGVVHVIRGAITTGDPFADGGFINDAADISAAGQVITTAANQYIAVIGTCSDNASTSVVVTSTDPATYTARSYTVTNVGADAGQYFRDATRATAGPTGTLSLDFSALPPITSGAVLAILAPPATGGLGWISSDGGWF